MMYIQNNNRMNHKGFVKKSLFTLTAAGFIFLSAIPVQAAEEERTPVDTVTLDVAASIEVGDTGSEVDVTTDSDECEVTTVDVTNEPNGEWGHKDKPKIEVTLEADHDYYFQSGFGKKKIKITGSKGTVSGIKRKSKEEVKVTITLSALKATDSDYDLEIDEAGWNTMNGVAEWSDSEDAKSYEVRLYRDGKFINTVKPGKNTSCNLSGYLGKAGSYYFEVRGIYSSSRKGDWQESDSFDVTEKKAVELAAEAAYKPSGNGPAAGTWKSDAVGWWYANSDGSYTVNNWQQIDGKWYYFDENGYRKSGWFFWKEKWYFMNENGEMLTNTVTPDGKTVGEDGALVS